MKQELDSLLCSRYPEILANRYLPASETCMYWGFDCGDGWFNILDRLLHSIQHYTTRKNRRGQFVVPVTLDQVKEKLGTLSFYYTGGDEVIAGMVMLAGSMSAVTCEHCGNAGRMEIKSGWITTLCEKHRDEQP